MENHTLIPLITLVSILMPWGVQAESLPDEIKTLEVECSSKSYFTDNECDICQDGGEIFTNGTGAIANAQEFTWGNDLTGINQNFYKSGQPAAEIKTNIGTPSTTWDQTGLDWGADVIFTKVDIQNVFSLDPGKTVKIKAIADKTNIPVTSIKDTINPYLIVKIPISYYELGLGASSQGDKKTTNYCVSYTPKKVAGTTTTTPTTTTPTPKPPVTPTTTPTTTTTTTPKPTPTPVTTPPATTTPKPVTETPKTVVEKEPEKLIARDPKEIEKETAEKIPTYNAKVSLNAAPADPNMVAATHVETGPEDMLIIVAALLLSILLYPKLNKIFN